MTPREFRQEQNFDFDHFQELTQTGINPNYVNIELFAHQYHKAKLKLLGIADVIGSASFQKAIKDAIEYGKGTDWGYDGEDEFTFDTFDSDESLQEVIRVLKEHFL
jgi:hypothetical protein